LSPYVTGPNLAFGLGLKKGKFSIESRANLRRDLLGSGLALYRNVTLVAGYTLF